jgi:hypothetical protein
MRGLKRYVIERKGRDREFAEGFEKGYVQFKLGATVRSFPPQEFLAIPGTAADIILKPRYRYGLSTCPNKTSAAALRGFTHA